MKALACTRETARCEFWTREEEYLRPECCTAHLQELLFFTEELLTKHGIVHWLDYGSLLGAARRQELIPWDSDVDFGVLLPDLEKLRALDGEISSAGYVLDMQDPCVSRINYSRRNTQHVDLYPWFEEAGLLKMRWPNATPERWAFPRRYLDGLGRVELCGRRFPAPSPVDEFLANYRYGPDYRTPRRPREAEEYQQTVGMARIENTVRSFVARRRQIMAFERNLVALHDALASTALDGRYWIIGGLLIGWAREGRILPHDSHDADFGFFRQDRERFLSATPALIGAGFEPLYKYVDNHGEPVEYKFRKDGATFDFFEHVPTESGTRCTFFGILHHGGTRVPTEMVSMVPAYGLAPMDFLGRTWRKPDDHDGYMTAIYGDWRVPNPDHDYQTDDRSILERRPWTGEWQWQP